MDVQAPFWKLIDPRSRLITGYLSQKSNPRAT
jgi:hypothetical protein